MLPARFLVLDQSFQASVMIVFNQVLVRNQKAKLVFIFSPLTNPNHLKEVD